MEFKQRNRNFFADVQFKGIALQFLICLLLMDQILASPTNVNHSLLSPIRMRHYEQQPRADELRLTDIIRNYAIARQLHHQPGRLRNLAPESTYNRINNSIKSSDFKLGGQEAYASSLKEEKKKEAEPEEEWNRSDRSYYGWLDFRKRPSGREDYPLY